MPRRSITRESRSWQRHFRRGQEPCCAGNFWAWRARERTATYRPTGPKPTTSPAPAGSWWVWQPPYWTLIWRSIIRQSTTRRSIIRRSIIRRSIIRRSITRRSQSQSASACLKTHSCQMPNTLRSAAVPSCMDGSQLGDNDKHKVSGRCIWNGPVVSLKL